MVISVVLTVVFSLVSNSGTWQWNLSGNATQISLIHCTVPLNRQYSLNVRKLKLTVSASKHLNSTNWGVTRHSDPRLNIFNAVRSTKVWDTYEPKYVLDSCIKCSPSTRIVCLVHTKDPRLDTLRRPEGQDIDGLLVMG